MFSSPIDARRFPQVAFDSSIAKIPRPGEAIVFAVLTSSSAYEPARMVSTEGATGLQRTTETEGWRSDWPFTHSDLSRTGDDLRREADAMVYSCYLLIFFSLPQEHPLLPPLFRFVRCTHIGHINQSIIKGSGPLPYHLITIPNADFTTPALIIVRQRPVGCF